MKKFFLVIATAITAVLTATNINAQNTTPDSIIGDYECTEKGNECKVRIAKEADGTYSGTLFWVKDDIDPKTGEPWRDYRNPDKSLRNRFTHDIKIIEGLKYNAEKKHWEKGKIYDPNRGLKANCNAKFEGEGTLVMRGQVLGIGESIVWKKIK